jgi:pimeloyl-ACP methyl ester carboxylesterase
MAIANFDGLKLSYQAIGDGPPVVMVHGLLSNSAFWRLVIAPVLSRSYKIVTYDMRGHGRSGMPPCDYTSAQMAADLERLIDYLDLPPVHLVGHSFGGEVALQLAIRSPKRVKTISLMDARVRALFPSLLEYGGTDSLIAQIAELGAGIRPDQPVPISRILAVQRILEDWRRAPLSLPTSRFADGTHSFDLGVNQARTVERWIRLFGTTTINRDFRTAAGMTPIQLLQLRIPVFAMYGGQSVFFPILARLQAYLPQCSSCVASGAGHFFPITQPDLTIRHLLGFLSGTDGAARQSAGPSDEDRRRLQP